jgi:outer membrane protein TolC
MRERVAAGAAVGSDLAQAEIDLLRARLNAINAIIDARLALARIRRATGERETVDTHP